jgi:hypothetical protein
LASHCSSDLAQHRDAGLREFERGGVEGHLADPGRSPCVVKQAGFGQDELAERFAAALAAENRHEATVRGWLATALEESAHLGGSE